MSHDGIEIHFDEKRGHLELGCERDAFASYRDLAREHLNGIPDIPIDKVVEISIVDTATFVARREAPKRRLWDIAFAVFVVALLILAVVGAYAIIARKIAF
jgi:hypothetical protein